MTFQVNGDSKEAVAFGLMQCVLFAQGRGNHDHPFAQGSALLRGQTACSEMEILSLYVRCLRAVQGEVPVGEPHPAMAAASPTQLHS